MLPVQLVAACLGLLAAGGLRAEEAGAAPLDLRALFQQGIPPSPWADVAYRYADALIEHGRDVHGPERTGLFLASLDRVSLAPIEPLRANPQLDENLLRLLYLLRELSGKEGYATVADEVLRWCLRGAAASGTGFLSWGRGAWWDAASDSAVRDPASTSEDFARPWVLWDRCFELDPAASRGLALALRRSAAARGTSSPRQAGFAIRVWADAWGRTADPELLEAIEGVVRRWEAVPPGSSGPAPPIVRETAAPAAQRLSLAIDLDGAARKVPEPLRGRLRTCAAREDDAFCSLPHDLRGRKAFAAGRNAAGEGPTHDWTRLWEPGSDGITCAAVAMMCVSRYENTGDIRYRELLVGAAEAYLDALPGDGIDAWPMTFGHAISLELAAFRETSRGEFLRRATALADLAVARFLGESPLPRASLRSERYEGATGAATLALAFVELHLAVRHITAVRGLPNTIDR